MIFYVREGLVAVEQGLGLINAIASPQSGTGQSLMALLGLGAEYGILQPFMKSSSPNVKKYFTYH